MSDKINRRDFIKSSLAGAGLLVGSTLMAGKWHKPAMAAGGLPVHAKASGDATATPAGPTPTAAPTMIPNAPVLFGKTGHLQELGVFIIDELSIRVLDPNSDPVEGIEITLGSPIAIIGTPPYVYTITANGAPITSSSAGFCVWTDVKVEWPDATSDYGIQIWVSNSNGDGVYAEFSTY